MRCMFEGLEMNEKELKVLQESLGKIDDTLPFLLEKRLAVSHLSSCQPLQGVKPLYDDAKEERKMKHMISFFEKLSSYVPVVGEVHVLQRIRKKFFPL